MKKSSVGQTTRKRRSTDTRMQVIRHYWAWEFLDFA
jgi:hypothetical protein